MAHVIASLCLILATLAPLTAQSGTPTTQAEPPEAQAEGKVVGSVAGKTITERDFAIVLAARYLNHELGRDIIEDYRDRFLVRQAMEKLRVTVTEADVDAEYRAIDGRVKKQTQGKLSLDQVLARKKTNREDFRASLRRLVTVRKIVRAEKKLGADEGVSDEAVRAWLQSSAAAAKVIQNAAALPPEVVLDVNGARLTRVRLGQEILATLALKDRARELNRTLNERVMAAAMSARGLEVVAADMDAAIERERKRYANHPQTRTVAYEAILKQLGTTIAKRRQDPNLRANVALRKICEATYSDEQLEAFYAAHQDQLGPSVHVRHILARVKAASNPFAPGLTADAAKARIEDLRRAIIGGEKFEKIARMKSDDRSRLNGGDIGFIFRRGRIDPTFADAAFGLEVGAISAPVRSSAGYHLIQVVEKRPAAPFASVRDKVLRARARDWFQQAVREAELSNVYLDRLREQGQQAAGRKSPARRTGAKSGETKTG